MNTLKIFQVDAFTDKLFGGNPAAVVPLEQWLPDDIMQKIASENNLAETAYIVNEQSGYRIRWFTPSTEVDLCGHATLASGYVMFNNLNYKNNKIAFQSRSGLLGVTKKNDMLTLDFPVTKLTAMDLNDDVSNALGAAPAELYWCTDKEDLLGVFNSQKEIENLSPDSKALIKVAKHGIIATAKGEKTDFVSRCFYPAYGIDEDPVTGSAHTKTTPYWAEKLGKTRLTARQLSKRKGDLICELKGDRVMISGKAVLYMIGEIYY